MRQQLWVCALALGLAIPVAGLASATSEDHVSVTVRYHDGGLDRPREAAQMLRRIDSAALEACGAAPGSLREYREAVGKSACHEDGVSRAVADLNISAVTALYNRRLSAPAASD